jgi:hypothetical protein
MRKKITEKMKSYPVLSMRQMVKKFYKMKITRNL